MIKLPRVVDANLNEIRRVQAIDASISLNAVPLSTASITVKTANMVPIRSFVEMYNIYGSVGVFRVRSTDDGYGDDVSTIELDHSVAEVGDFICDAEINETSTLSAALIKVFGYYKGTCWQLSAGSYSDSVVVDVDYDNVLEAMLDILEQAPEYMLTFNFNTRPWTIGVAHRDTFVTAEGRLSRNVISASVAYDDSDLCTKVYVDYQENNKDKVYTKSSNTSKYGVIEKHISGSGYTESQAQTVANTYLLYHSEPTVSVTIDGVELANITGESLDSLALGKMYRLAIPKYGVVVDEPITGLSWPNVYTNPKKVEVSLASVTDPVVKFIKKTSKSGSGTKKKVKKDSKEYWTKFEQTDEQITMTAAHVATNGSILQQAGMGLDANGLLVYAEDNINNIGSKFRVQANAINAEVTRATVAESVLSGRLDVTAEAITAEVTRASTAEGELSGRITVTAEAINQEVSRATAAEGTLSGRITVEANRITQEVSRASAAEGALSGRITVEANRITQEVTRATNAESSLSGRITTEAGKVAMVVEEKDGQNVIKAGAIVLAINDNKATAHIDADAVYIGNQKSTTVINGKLNTGDLTADLISSILLNSSVISTNYMFSKSFEVGTGNFTMDGYNCEVPDAFYALTIEQDGNTYTLKGKHFYSVAWETIGTFSRATTLTGEWSGTVTAGKSYKVTASPQGTTHYSPSLDGISRRNNKSWATNKKSFSQTLYVYDANGTDLYEENLTFTTTESYDAGYNGAAGAMSWPSSTSSEKTSTTIGYPTSGGGSTTKSLELSADASAVYVKLGGTVVLKMAN